MALHPDLRPWGVIGLDPLPEHALTDAMIPLTNGGIARIEEVGGVVMLDAGELERNGPDGASRGDARRSTSPHRLQSRPHRALYRTAFVV